MMARYDGGPLGLPPVAGGDADAGGGGFGDLLGTVLGGGGLPRPDRRPRFQFEQLRHRPQRRRRVERRHG